MNDPAADRQDLPPLKITVATVTYNAADFLERTIQSVEQQDYPYVEHVVVDGLSKDDTPILLHQYQERNGTSEHRHEINLLMESDRGLYDAMNKAINMATGNYILFLNAGDRFHSAGTLSAIASAAQQESQKSGQLPAVVYGDTHIVDNDGQFLRQRRLTPPEQLTWKSFRYGMLVCHQAFFTRIDLAKNCLYDLRYRFSADFDWCIRLMKRAASIQSPLTNAHLVVADYLDGGLTTKNHRKSLRERFRIMTRHYGWLTTIAMHFFFLFRSVIKK